MSVPASSTVTTERPLARSPTAADTYNVGDSFALLAAWVEWMQARDLAPTTIRSYENGVTALARHHRWKVSLVEMDEQAIVTFLASIGDRSPTKQLHAKGIRSFYQFCVRRQVLLFDPTTDCSPRRRWPGEPVRFELDEMTRLLIAAAWREERRAWALLACFALGARRTEFCLLPLADIDWGKRLVVFRHTKGNRPRTVDMGPWAFEACSELLRWSDGERLLPIAPNWFNRWMADAGSDAGIPRARLHTLRATFASILLDDGQPPQVVQRLLGHQSLATTTRYAAIGRDRPTAKAVQVLG